MNCAGFFPRLINSKMKRWWHLQNGWSESFAAVIQSSVSYDFVSNLEDKVELYGMVLLG